MQLRFDLNKSMDAACHVLQLHQEPMDFLNLIKVLYWTDKKALIDWGRTVTGDKLMAMPQGPALCEINRLIHGDGLIKHQRRWNRHFSDLFHKEGSPSHQKRYIRLKSPVGSGSISQAEEELLQQAHAQFGKLPYRALMQAVHNRTHFPEWSKPRHQASESIDPVTILQQACKSPDEIGAIQESFAHHAYVRRLLKT